MSGDFSARVALVRERVDIGDVIGAAVKLRGRGNARGQCPFHGSKSDSLAVYGDKGRARCWGCGWTGDAIKFVQDFYGLDFKDALERLEADAGLSGLDAAPVHRARQPHQRRPREEEPVVDSATMGRWLWKHGLPELGRVRSYLRARGVPDALLGDHRLSDFRFVALGPIVPWKLSGKPSDVPQAPAMVALVRKRDAIGHWQPIGVHVTWLNPACDGKMERQRPRGGAYPARKMLGPVGGGAVLLYSRPSIVAEIDPACALFVGEGIETVLSGMAMLGGGDDATGLAVLSLDNLQGHPRLIAGAIPLYDVRPDVERAPALAFDHMGPVTGLIDADMKPLRGPRDPRSGAFRDVPVIERRPLKGNRPVIVDRAITTAERTSICAQLFTHAWRAHGCSVRAERPRMGQDFNNAIQEVL